MIYDTMIRYNNVPLWLSLSPQQLICFKPKGCQCFSALICVPKTICFTSPPENTSEPIQWSSNKIAVTARLLHNRTNFPVWKRAYRGVVPIFDRAHLDDIVRTPCAFPHDGSHDTRKKLALLVGSIKETAWPYMSLWTYTQESAKVRHYQHQLAIRHGQPRRVAGPANDIQMHR